MADEIYRPKRVHPSHFGFIDTSKNPENSVTTGTIVMVPIDKFDEMTTKIANLEKSVEYAEKMYAKHLTEIKDLRKKNKKLEKKIELANENIVVA